MLARRISFIRSDLDKFETLAYDYHDGYYNLVIKGRPNPENALLELPVRVKYMNANTMAPVIKLFNALGEEKNVFRTNETVKCVINLAESKRYAKM